MNPVILALFVFVGAVSMGIFFRFLFGQIGKKEREQEYAEILANEQRSRDDLAKKAQEKTKEFLVEEESSATIKDLPAVQMPADSEK